MIDDDAKTEPSRSLPTFEQHTPRWRLHVHNALWVLLVAISVMLFGGIGGLVARAVPVRLQGCTVMCCQTPETKK